MPTSQIDQIPHVVSLVQRIRPSSVLDLGLGFGKYGFLLREYLDVCGAIESSTRDSDSVGVQGARVVIDGVEGCSEYLGPLQRGIYDRIFEVNALEACQSIATGQYDCCLLIDVLEHLTTGDGSRLLSEIHRIAHAAIVSTPKRFLAQGDLCGNTLERHRSVWSRQELAACGFDVYRPTKSSHIAVHSASAEVRSSLRRLILRARCKELTPIGAYEIYQRLRYGSERT